MHFVRFTASIQQPCPEGLCPRRHAPWKPACCRRASGEVRAAPGSLAALQRKAMAQGWRSVRRRQNLRFRAPHAPQHAAHQGGVSHTWPRSVARGVRACTISSTISPYVSGSTPPSGLFRLASTGIIANMRPTEQSCRQRVAVTPGDREKRERKKTCICLRMSRRRPAPPAHAMLLLT